MTYEYTHIGNDAKSIEALTSGKDKFATKLLKAKRPIIVLGTGCLQRKDGQQILDFVRTMCAKLRAAGSVSSDWQLLSVMHRVASQVQPLFCTLTFDTCYCVITVLAPIFDSSTPTKLSNSLWCPSNWDIFQKFF